MTLKQGENINKQFSDLNDSIITLNKQLLFTNSSIKTLEVQKIELNKNIVDVNDSLSSSNNQIKRLNTLLTKREREFWNEKKNWAGWMFFSFFVTVMVSALK